MTSAGFHFDRFILDPDDRQLRRDGAPVELNSRYFDALTLLVREQGRLVSKDRFLDEVWSGVPVTDEALTQCIKTLRRQLGDDVASPRFIETVPKHGYRFIAPVDGSAPKHQEGPIPVRPSHEVLLLAAAGTVGGGVAGFIGGLIYGFAVASEPLQPGTGAISVLLVLLCLTILVALMGGAGVSLGIAAATRLSGRLWPIAGGAVGGIMVGAAVKFLGFDAFNLLLGRSPGEITGPFEGFVIGAAVGVAYCLAALLATAPRWQRILVAALSGGGGGLLVASLGGRMMASSLVQLAHQFPGSRLRMDRIGTLFGENGFGQTTQMVTAALEGALFAAGVVTAMRLARRSLGYPVDK